MEFIDNTGHIFSLPSYDRKPIGYEYEENSYIFWIDSNTSKLSINNYYSRPIYALYLLDDNYITSNNEDIIDVLSDDENSPIQITIEIEKSNIFKLIKSKEFNEYILSDKYNDLNDYIDLGDESSSDYISSKLTNKDLLVIKTTEEIESKSNNLKPAQFNYLLIPIYPLVNSPEPGTWITNILIHIQDTQNNIDTYCPISIGGEFINEYEELIINAQNIGVKLPKDIIKAVYDESLYNDVFNEALYNEKLKEYLINTSIIKNECGNFNSAIASLKWFGYGDKLSIAKLLRTDNSFANQYLLDYFDIKNDVIESFKSFTSTALISLRLMINKEIDDLYKFNINNELQFFGENKPKMISLLDHYEKIKIGNHDMPIENDDEKYWYWKPYFDFSFNELGIKLACLKTFYKKYFLPLHLYIHSASLGYKVYANDIKYTVVPGISMCEPSISLNNRSSEVEFSKFNTYYFTKQIHYIDNYFNEFKLNNIENDKRLWYRINDTCINIPIKFINNENNKGYFNCVFLLLNYNISDKPLFESRFSFYQTDDYNYKNFIIYPKKLNVLIDKDMDFSSNYFNYWINNDFILKILVNNKWYEYKFNTKINNPIIDFGTLKYRYYLNDNNYLINRIKDNKTLHTLIFTPEIDSINSSYNLSNIVENISEESLIDSIYSITNLDSNISFIKTLDLSTNIENLYQYFDSNYNIISPFTQLSRIDDENKHISFNSFMYNCELTHVNNIDFDIDFYKILKYHLDHNLMYIDGTLLNREFYQFILYNYEGEKKEILLHKDIIGNDIEIPTSYLNNDKIIVCAWNDNIYILEEVAERSNSYFINVITDTIFVSEDDDSYALLLNSLNLRYDRIRNGYYKIELNITTGEEEETEFYYIYDKLYNNIDYINNKYNYKANIPNLDKYKNSLHLFNIYCNERQEKNILIYHNDLDIYINGICFKKHKYNSNDEDTLKIYLQGNPHSSLTNTNEPDIYGLHLITPLIQNGQITNIPEEIRNNNYEYGIYVKRDYEKYFNKTINNIYELENIFKYDTNEFSYYKLTITDEETGISNNKLIKIGSMKFQTLNDLYNDNPIEISLENNYTNIKIFRENTTYYFYDLETKDLSNLSKKYKNKIIYTIEFYDAENQKIENVSIDNISNDLYNYVKINLYYQPVYIVRNRYYLLIDYINEYAEQGYNFEFSNDCSILTMSKDNNFSVNIPLIKLNPKYIYRDKIEGHDILNQNPAYYWFNMDNNSINTLPSYLNELERFIYDNNNESIEYIINMLESYKTKFENNNHDDSNEARYKYINYLSKDFTGKSGLFKLTLEQGSNNDENEIQNINARLYLEIFDETNNLITYTDEDDEFMLSGNEQKVTLYIQIQELSDEDIELDYYLLPKLIKICNIDKQLEYNIKEEPEDILTFNILNKEYKFGNNTSEYVYKLYKDFFKLKYNIYDSYINGDTLECSLLNSIYDVNDKLNLDMLLDYDFYLMHDDKYWYGLYISRQTCNFAQKKSSLKIPDDKKEIEFVGNETNITYKLKHNVSSNEFLLNRMEFISSNGLNQFKNDDIICCNIYNNDRLPFNPYISSKWFITPMSIGISEDTKFESNAEMTILSLPKNDTKYQKGYYKVTVKYSLDRDIQHQFKNTTTFKIS